MIKRILRICRKYDIKSNIKWKPLRVVARGDRNPDHIAKTIYTVNSSHAEKPNEKGLPDVLNLNTTTE